MASASVIPSSAPSTSRRARRYRHLVAQVAHKPSAVEDVVTWASWNAGLRDSADLYEGAVIPVAAAPDPTLEKCDDQHEPHPVTAVVVPSGATVLFRDAIDAAWLEAFPDGATSALLVHASSRSAPVTAPRPADTAAAAAAAAALPSLAALESPGVQAARAAEVASPTAGTPVALSEPAHRQCEAAEVQAEQHGSPPSTASTSRPRWTSASAGIRPPWSDNDSVAPTASARRTDAQSTQKDTESVLIRHGMSELQAERLALELHGTQSAYADTALLEAKLESLQLLLPGVNVCALVLQDMDVLTADIGHAAQRMVTMSTLLGGLDLTQIITRNPVLLYSEDVEVCLRRTLETFDRVLPSDYPRSVVQSVLTEAPMIIFRLEHSLEAQEFSDLPSDIQRLFIIGARGGAPATTRPSWKRLVQALNRGVHE